VYRLKPQLLYLFWENQRQVQPNEFGKMPGLWQLLSWQLLVFTDRGEQKFPGWGVAWGAWEFQPASSRPIPNLIAIHQQILMC
jgi:hypothetical protein